MRAISRDLLEWRRPSYQKEGWVSPGKRRERKNKNTRTSRTCRVEIGREGWKREGGSVYVKAGRRRKRVVKATERGDIR